MKKSLSYTLATIYSLALVACGSSDQQNNPINMDFDSFKNWGIQHPMLTDKMARKSKWATYVDSTHEYSMTYECTLEDLKAKGYKKAVFSAWFKSNTNVKDVSLVLAINSPTGVNYQWKGIKINTIEGNDENGWKEVTVDLDLNKDAPKGIFKAYVWSPKREEAFVDDFSIKFE